MKLGMVGMGRMGVGMTGRLRARGHEVVAYDRRSEASEVADLGALVDSLEPPRAVWSMVPAGEPTEETVAGLGALLESGDVVVDGGNSNYRDSVRRADSFRAAGVGFVDAGVSGGIWGEAEGFCLMVGGREEDVARLQPVFDALAPPGGFAHVGPNGAGHFTKMVHNGVEYGLMQAYAEGYELLSASDLEIDVPGALGAWRHGSVVRSWLLELLVKALEQDPGLGDVRGYADDSGEGRWAIEEAVAAGVPAPVISAALFARFASRQEESPAMKVVAALRREFGGHAVRKAAPEPDGEGA